MLKSILIAGAASLSLAVPSLAEQHVEGEDGDMQAKMQQCQQMMQSGAANDPNMAAQMQECRDMMAQHQQMMQQIRCQGEMQGQTMQQDQMRQDRDAEPNDAAGPDAARPDAAA